MEKFDILIVGAGTAGCVAAKTAAQLGLKVCLVDRKPRDKIGEKICGDAVGKHHFDSLNLAYPSGDELACKIVGVKVYSPDRKTMFRIRGEGLQGFMINRYEFGQRLLNEALDQGIGFVDGVMALKPIVEGGFVRGVQARDLNRSKVSKFYSTVTLDASGFAAVLRQKLPPSWGLEDVAHEDVIICYREIRKISSAIDLDYCQIYLEQKTSPGGYYWIFPKGNDEVNVGLGVQMKGAYPNPKGLLYGNVLSQPLFRNSKVLTGGGGVVPTRRPLDCLVANGIMLVGDAACMVNAIHGGGIGSSMMGGKLAAEAAASAIEKGGVSREELWQYNLEYMQNYGAKQAGLDVFRLFLQRLTNDELNFGMEHKLIKEEDILHASMGDDLKLNITDKSMRMLRGLKRLGLLNRLRSTAKMMRNLKNLHQQYPMPSEFDGWRKQIRQIYAELKKAAL